MSNLTTRETEMIRSIDRISRMATRLEYLGPFNLTEIHEGLRKAKGAILQRPTLREEEWTRNEDLREEEPG